MNINIVSGFDPAIQRASGIKSYVLALARQLIKLEQNVTVLGLGSGISEIDGVRFVPVTQNVRNSAFFILAVGRYLSHERSLDGVVHAQRPDDLVPFHLQAGHLPKVVTLHGVHGVHVAARRGSVAASVYHLAEHYSLTHTDSILCVSADTFAHFRSEYPEIVPRLTRMPAGIDMDLFSLHDKSKARERAGLPPNGKTILFVGRFEPEKNPTVVVEEFLRIREHHADLDLVMVGNGQFGPALREHAATGQIGIRILDPMSQEELTWFLSAADVLAVASRHEGLPTVALEALACGIPVVGTKVGILPDVVKEGINGYLTDSLNGLGESLERALYQTDWSQEKCRDSVKQFGWDSVAPAILEIYRQAVKDSPEGR